MITLSYGFKKPELKDLGPVVFPALEDNWQQVNDHDHDGLNSAKINIDANLPLQTGNAGKFLTTNGTTSSWATVAVGEVNTASNVGGGNGLFKQKSGVDLEFKTLVAGANTTITPVGDTLVIASSYVDTGEVNTASNVGGGSGLFKQKSGVDLQFYTLAAGSGVSLTQVGDTIQIASTVVPGESNTASNVGGGSGLFKQKVGVDLQFYTLVAGSNISITPVGDTFVIDATVPAAGANTSLSNLIATAINQNLIFQGSPQVAYQSPSTTTWTIGTADTTAPLDQNSSHNLLITTGYSNFGSTGSLTIRTPQATNVAWGAGVVRSGDIIIDVGISASVPTITPGKFKIKDQSNGGGTTGTIGHVWTQTAADGSGQWAAPAATGANTTLSNLGVTAINSALVSAADNTLDLGSPTNRWFNIHGQVISGYSQIGWRDFATALPILNMFATAFLTATNGAFISGPHQNLGVTYDAFGFRGRNANAGVASLPIIIGTGNGGTGANSGGILLQTGTSTATRGKIQFKDGTEGTAGHVWTSTDTNGNGRWQVLPGASITAGMFVKAYSSTGFNNVFAPSYQDFPMDTIVEDTHSMYNTGNGEITIPLSYSGQARGVITLTLCLNSSVQTSYIRTQIYKNGSFYGYGAAFNNAGANNANEIYQGTFHVTGVAGDKFKVGYYSNSNNFMAGGAGASRIDVSFFPK